MSLTYPGGVTALDGLDLKIPAGGCTALVGANGSGKSTLLKLVAGALEPTGGCLQRPGTSIGYAAQAPALDPEMTGIETCALFAALSRLPRSGRTAAIDAIGRRFGLRAHLPRTVATYSGGLKRRLHLALVWLTRPGWLLLDEPTANLDPDGRALVWELIAERRADGATIVIASHDLAEVERHCTQVVVLERGRLLAVAPPLELIRRHGGPSMLLRFGARPAIDGAAVTRVVRAVDGVRAVRWRGDEVAIVSEPGGRVQDAVVEALAGAGCPVSGITFIRGDLERAYFELSGHAAAGEDPT